MSNNRPQVPASSASNGGALESSQKPASGPINVAAAQENAGSPNVGSDPAFATTPDIIDIEQDNYARKRGYRNIDELLDNPRRR